jgi:hypothetical protein
MGVESKENNPLSASSAERRGFRQHGCSMLSVALHCVVRQHQLAMGNDFGSPAILARKQFFHVRMACLAGLCYGCPGECTGCKFAP